MSSLTSPNGSGNNRKAPQKKSLEIRGFSPPSRKKQKVIGSLSDQTIEQLNDVTAVSGVNLREEDERLFSGADGCSRFPEASRRLVEEEERLILHKIPLQKKLVEIMEKCGLKNMSTDVERCLSLCVEERMHRLIASLIRLSKQRVDLEKPRHRTIVTSDVKKQIMTINSKAREEWEKKLAESEKALKQNEHDCCSGVDDDKEKDGSRAKSAKANKEEEDNKMRAMAANVAVRAAAGIGDVLSRWQIMVEAKQKQGATSSVSQTGEESTRNPLKKTRGVHEAEQAGFSTPDLARKVGRNQLLVPARSISVKDVIAISEREPRIRNLHKVLLV